ncbi:MAG: hypothetical protein L6Q84_05335 [Polyangiaceae bacterium]|nr:hypothetical protein [Polyangiaceae bacterium]
MAGPARLSLALDQVHKLEKIVQMCAWTKRFEIDGQWVDIEEFLARRYGVTVSHGISEDMAAELDPDTER